MALDGDGHEFSVSRTYPVSAPFPGFTETKTSFWLDALKDAVSCLPQAAAISSIGLSGQMHGIVPVSLAEGALHPAILWADQRGKSELSVFASLPSVMKEKLRNTPAAGMAATSVLWLKKNRRAVYDSTDFFLFPKDFIRYVLTGEIATDFSDASGSLLYDFDTGGWYAGLLDHLEIDIRKLPPIRRSDESCGRVTAQGAESTGLAAGIPVATGAGDTPSAILGSGLADEDTIQISIGTGAQIVRLCHEVPGYEPAVHLFESATSGLHYRMSAMLNGGLALDWVRGIIGLAWNEVYAELEKEGTEKPYDLMFLPYLTGERTPYMNPDARGIWNGLALHHGRIELIHSALMGVACSVRLGLEALGTGGVRHYRLVGGSTRFPYWNELLASMLGVELEISCITDSSARGAVFLGASSIGSSLSGECRVSLVEPEHDGRIDEYFRRFKETYRRNYSS